MKRNRWLRYFSKIAANRIRIRHVFALVLIVFFIYRPVVKWIVSPWDTRASWVEPLATFGSGVHSNPEFPPFARLRPGMEEEQKLILKSNKQKLKVIETFKAGKGRYGVLQRHSTVEGAWIYTWLIANEGKLTYIRDTTRDGGAPPWSVHSYPVKSFRIGHIEKSKFVEGIPTETDSPMIVLELDTDRYGGPSRFY